MTVENKSLSNSTNVWDRAGIELTTLGSAVGVTADCATKPNNIYRMIVQSCAGVASGVNPDQTTPSRAV